MKKITLFFSCFLFLCTSCQEQHPPASNGKPETYHLFFLGGQSNMEGYGRNSYLPKEWKAPQSKVIIFQSTPKNDLEKNDGKGKWALLTPGHGLGFQSDGIKNKLSSHFGPELSFGKKMSELIPDKNIAIIKYVKGGSSLEAGASGYGTWEPNFSEGNGINQYDHFLSAVENALKEKDINGDGINDKIIPSGIAWMQGEADAYHSKNSAEKYEQNLNKLMGLIRSAFQKKDLPIAIGRIRDSGKDVDGKLMDWCAAVQNAQLAFTEKDKHAALIETTSKCEFLEDGWHYDSECYLQLGADMAEAIFEKNKQLNSVKSEMERSDNPYR